MALLERSDGEKHVEILGGHKSRIALIVFHAASEPVRAEVVDAWANRRSILPTTRGLDG